MHKLKLLSAIVISAVLMTSLTSCSLTDKESEEQTEVSITTETTQKTKREYSDKELASDLGDFYTINCVYDKTATNGIYEIGFPLSGSSYNSVMCGDKLYYIQENSQYEDGILYGYYQINIVDANKFELIDSIEIPDSYLKPSLISFNGSVYFTYCDFALLKYYVMEIVENDDTSYSLEESTYMESVIFGEDYPEVVTEEGGPSSAVVQSLNYDDGVAVFVNLYGCQNLYFDEAKVVFIEKDSVTELRFPEENNCMGNLMDGAFTYGDKYMVFVGDYDIYVVDLETKTFSNQLIPYNLASAYNISYDTDNKILLNTLSGFYKIDPRQNDMKQLLDYNRVVGDTSVLYNSKFLFEKNGSYYFICDIVSKDDFLDGDLYYYGTSHTKVFKVSPSDNPYGDREVIDIASSVSDPQFVRRVKEFNESNDKYFLRFSIYDGSDPTMPKTLLGDSIPSYVLDNCYSYENYIKSEAKREEAQMMVLDNIGRIDVLYDFGLNGLLDSGDYCEDLSEYVASDNLINDGNYYMNVIDAKRKQDGSLYVMPITFEINGLALELNATDNSYTALDYFNDNGGITLEEYAALMDKLGLVFDPFAFRGMKCEVFNELISNESDVLFSDDDCTVQVDKERLAELVTYSDGIPTEDDLDGIYLELGQYAHFEYSRCSDASGFLSLSFVYEDDEDIEPDEVVNDVRIFGIPSTDGRGITADLSSCVSMKKDCDDKEGAWEVIRYFMTCSSDFCYRDYSINRNENERFQDEYFMGSQLIYTFSGDNYLDSGDYQAACMSSMEDTIDQIQGFRFRDAKVIALYISPLNDYFDGEITMDELLNSIEISEQSIKDNNKDQE